MRSKSDRGKWTLTNRAQQAVRTLHNIGTSVEEQESASAVRALGLALVQTLVPNERRLLVTCEACDGHTLQRTVSNVAVDFR